MRISDSSDFSDVDELSYESDNTSQQPPRRAAKNVASYDEVTFVLNVGR